MGKLIEAINALKEQRQIMDEHSPVVAEQRVQELSHAYAQEPTAENLEALRHAKSLDASDHARTQEYAQLRTRAILEELTPSIRPILAKAAELCQETAQSLWAQESAIYRSFDLAPTPSPLARGLAALAREFKQQSESAAAFDGLPEIVEKLLVMES
jgi:hypothetical protein